MFDHEAEFVAVGPEVFEELFATSRIHREEWTVELDVAKANKGGLELCPILVVIFVCPGPVCRGGWSVIAE